MFKPVWFGQNPLHITRFAIADAYAQFCAELKNREIRDNHGHVVTVLERTFPKLLGMKLADPETGEPLLNQSGRPVKAKASVVLAALNDGTFDAKNYYVEAGRLTTLFWIPDVIENCDGIHPNGHEVGGPIQWSTLAWHP